MMISRFFLAMLVLASPSISMAEYIHVVTFDGISGSATNGPWLESGVTATGTGAVASHGTPNAAHIDRAGTPLASGITFTTGSVFNPESLMLKALGSGYCSGNCQASSYSDPLPYIWFSGYLNGSLVGSLGLFRPASDQFELVSLGFLGGIDLLRVESKTYLDLGMTGLCNVNQGCGHFDIDNVTLKTSVPEPGTLALLLTGVLGAAGLRRRRSSSEKVGEGS